MSLAMKAARGAIYSVIGGVGGRAIGLISTLVLTRFVPPPEYGAVSVAMVTAMAATSLVGLGLFHWVMVTPDASRGAVFHATFYHLVLGALALVIVLLGKNHWAAAFNAPAAAIYLPGMVLVNLLIHVSVPPERILARDLRFGQLALARGVAELLYAGVSIGFAVMGFGGMSIVYGNLVQWSVSLVWIVLLVNWRDWIEPTKLSWKQTKELLSFGLPMYFGGVAHEAARSWDNLLVSRFFGEATVGRYNLAYNLADIPATHIGEYVGDVLQPSLSRVDQGARADALIRATKMLALVVFPMAVGLAAVADTLTAAVFDAKWQEMAPMLAMLSALSIFRPVGSNVGAFQLADRQPTMVASLEVAKVGLVFGALLAIGRYGVLWACLAPGIAFGLHALGSMIAVRITNGISLLSFMGSLLPPLLATLPMAAAVRGMHYLFQSQGFGPNILTLVITIAVGGIVFIPSAFLIAPGTAKDVTRTIMRAMGRGSNKDDVVQEDDDSQSVDSASPGPKEGEAGESEHPLDDQ